MKLPSLTFTSFDKAIVAAVLAPLISLATSYVNGAHLNQQTIITAVVAPVVAGVAVYVKGNLPTTQAATILPKS
jgi:hypothetical protein